jgi:hypothetical protein
MKVYVVYYTDGLGMSDRFCGVFDSPESCITFIDRQDFSWYYDWFSSKVLSKDDLTLDDV